MKYLIYQLIHFISFWLPLKVAYWLGERIADLRYLFCKESRETIESNLKQVLGEKEEKEIKRKTRKVFQNFAKYVVDFSRFCRINQKNLEKFITIEGMENLKRAFAARKGVIALTAHLGNWELGGATLAISGYPINAVALDHEETSVNRLFVRQRTKKGVKVIPFGMAASRCYRALHRNEMVALLGDWDIKSQGIETRFLGRLTTLPRGPAVLSLKTGAAILPGFTIRQEDDRFKLFLEKPIFPESTGRKEEDINKLSAQVNKVMENYIRSYPEQWFLFHKVWPEEDREQIIPNKS
ncbi:MAG: hypothetical protein GXO98_06250 [Nitrospirae bacterium]|nr:hypothetical protein [Nitrospirota bacterium]